jgi:hypothetical protein
MLGIRNIKINEESPERLYYSGGIVRNYAWRED